MKRVCGICPFRHAITHADRACRARVTDTDRIY